MLLNQYALYFISYHIADSWKSIGVKCPLNAAVFALSMSALSFSFFILCQIKNSNSLLTKLRLSEIFRKFANIKCEYS